MRHYMDCSILKNKCEKCLEEKVWTEFYVKRMKHGTFHKVCKKCSPKRSKGRFEGLKNTDPIQRGINFSIGRPPQS